MKPAIPYLILLTSLVSLRALLVGHESRFEIETGRLRAQNEMLARRVYDLDKIDPETGKPYVVGLIERAIEIEGVEWGDAEVAAMTRLCWRESRYNPLLKNPRSTAYGLWQFLDSTWRYYGIEKTSDPLLQTVAAVRYIEDRYGTPRKALEFHLVAREVNGVVQHYY